MAASLTSDLDSIARRFEQAWTGPSPPRIEDFLALAPASERRQLLIDLIAIDLDCRHRHGVSVALLDYLTRFPELAHDTDAIARLAVAEYDLLHRDQPHLTPDDYVHRLPRYVEEVRRRLGAVEQRRTDAPPTRTQAAPTVLQRLGDYELLEELGRGGMGVVYKARHVHLNKLVALKVLLPRWSADPDVARRFQREVAAIGRVEHANLVRATDAREVDGALLLVMELLEGEDLHQRTRREGPWPMAAACAAVRQAALGLQHAHDQGLVHRDLKPSNLFLTKGGAVKVLDLGLARLREDGGVGEHLTAPGAFMGTPDFVAPEQIADSRHADARADLYSLGCVLYYLLAGRAPFDDDRHTTIRSKLEAHRSEPPPTLRDLGREVPPAVAAILDKLLAKRPEDRYATAGEVAAALAPFAAEQSASTAPETAPPPPRTPPSTSIQTTKPTVPSPSHPNRWRWGLLPGLLAAAGVLVAWWLSHRGPPAGPPLEGFIDVEVERDPTKEMPWKRFGELRALPLRVGDKLRIVIENVNRPAYLYVIWVDTEGKVFPFYPWVDENWGWPEVETPVRGNIKLPLNGKTYQNEPGSAGMETILLLARDTPLPRSERLDQRLAGLGRASMDPAALAIAAWSFAADAQFHQAIAAGPAPRLLGIAEAAITAELPQGLVPDEAMWFADWNLKKYEPSRAARPTKTVEISHPAERFQLELRQRLEDLFGWSRAVSFGNLGGQ
jgi:serine/threonine protein kinase